MIHHVAIETPRERAGDSAAFYRLLGFRDVDPPPALRDRAAWLEREGTQVHLLYAEDPAIPPEGHLAVVVDDYDGTLRALREHGHEPEPRTAHWGSPRAFVHDPVGHRVEVMEFAPGAR